MGDTGGSAAPTYARAREPGRVDATPRRGIRWHLMQVQLVSIVPIGLFAATLLYLHWQAQERVRERAQIESARLLAAAVDNALDSTIERLSIFARLWSSTSLSEEAIYGQAIEARNANADWGDIFAYSADGRGVFRTDAPFGPEPPPSSRFDEWAPVLTERRPMITDVFLGARSGRPLAAVGVPVIDRGQVTHILIANLETSWYDQLLSRQRQPDGAIAEVMDRRFKIVARSVEGDARRGSDASAELVADMTRAREGIGRHVDGGGTAVYSAWAFTDHGWAVAFATPSAPVDNAFWSYLLWFGFLWAAAVGAATVHAFSKGRQIAASLESLEDQAEHFATGRRIANLPDSRVEEVSRALLALKKAGALLQATMRERDRAFTTEREARAAAEAANHAKDEFLAMLGHELRNPLAAISNAASIVRSEARTDEQIDFATGVIERQTRHLKRMIDDLLDVGRAVRGKIALVRTPVDLAASARHVLSALRTAGRLSDRRVDVDLTTAWVDGDPTRIEQILTNLIVNAERYTAPGGHIRVRTAAEDGTAVIEVADDGQGIAPEYLPRVFELFFQGDSTADRSTGGLGIGLTLVHRLATLHGGEAQARSDGPGRGATFTVRLPAIPAPAVEAGTAALTRQPGRGTVLIVEDNTDARESLSLALELQGYRVLESADGPAALDIMRRERPRVAVLDIGLPGMDGYELARRTRAEFGHDIALIALTGYGAAGDEDKAALAGFDRHLTKPVDVAELTEALAAQESMMRPARATPGATH